MDFLPLDDGGMIAFDPDTGDTHFVDAIGTEILNMIDTPKTDDEIFDTLSASYEGDKQAMQNDIAEFLQDLLIKKVIQLTEG